MPPKTVICSICGRTVNKRQTLLIGEGLRACHFHEETKKQSEELINRQKEEKKTNERRSKKKNFGFTSLESFEKQKDFVQNYCWCCCKKGIHIGDLYYKMLVGMEKLKLKNEQINFLNMPVQLKKEMNLLDVPTLVILEIHADITKNLHKMVQEVYSFSHIATLCVECMKKLNLFDKWQKSIPKPSLDIMLSLGAQYETSELAKHVLKDAVDTLEV